jgi:gliding motility-associated-like protein
VKKHLSILILTLIFAINALIAQDFFICTGTTLGTGNGTLRKVSLPSCGSQLKTSLTGIFNDITFHPSGKLYGIKQNGDMYELDTITGRQIFVVNFALPNIVAVFNALTANADGVIYAAADNGNLFSFNPLTNLKTFLGNIKVNNVTVNSAGDMTFYRGDLYIATTVNLVKVNLQNTLLSSTYMPFNVPNEIYGIVSFVECGKVATYATTGDASGTVYRIDWANRVLVNVCRTNQIIYGGASLYEFRASIATQDTVRIVNYTCDKTRAVVLPPRIFTNVLGCDSVILEQTNYVKPDTLLTASVTCDRSKVRADTLRFQNFRGCDSLVITVVKLGTDSVNSIKQICRGDSVIFYNQWLKQTGNYSKNFTKATGCDSVITLKLTVYDKQTTVKDSFVCQQNQVKRDTVFLKSFIGCDSFAVRNQEIAPRLNEKTPLSKLICKGDFVAIGQNRFYTEGSFSVVLKNAFGCDSTVNLSLRLLRSDSIVFKPETCDNSKLKDSIVVLKNQLGCDSTIYVKPVLIPNFNQINNLPKEVKLVIGDSFELKPQFNFSPTVINWSPTTYVNCTTCPSVFVRPKSSTSIRLFVKDSKGCSVQQDVKFLVDLNRRVYIPNTFSPNNDKINDVFTLFGDGNLLLISTLKIFNRWGEMVYSGSNLTPNLEGWDGQFKGQLLPPDVFVFYANLKFKDGEEVLFDGEINLVK